jgi:predicted TIM-barrel fold metal-dependent hydrolase
MEQLPQKKKPIINCHTHIFTGDHVPPYLAKTFLPAPLHKLLSLAWVVRGFRFYYRRIAPLHFRSWSKNSRERIYQVRIFIARNPLVKLLAFVLAVWLTVHVFFILFDWITMVVAPDSKAAGYVKDARTWLEERNLLFIPGSTWLKLGMVVIVMLFVKTGRNLILFVFKKLWGFLRLLPGPQTKELLKRYINIGRFSFHVEQSENYKRLRNQYPDDTGFIVLPMDMEYMGAGPLKKGYRYRDQMAALATIKKNSSYSHRFFPFVFADPRRMRAEPDYFAYTLDQDRKVVLKDCFVRQYIEEHRFSGFKIYPALGYYPFDYTLLPLWKYAADNGLPLLTHCIRGNIFYRGAKTKEWDYHPIFQQAAGKGEYGRLLLPEMKNIDFINNFTHPLNYLCLVEEEILRKWVAKGSPEIRQLFGYTDEQTKLGSDLSQLKICFGHFGGEDEWKRFMEFDRDNHSSQLIKKPHKGVDFLYNEKGEAIPGKIEQLWRDADWYTIIASMMLQYDNLYGDLSYILHDPEILPLLYRTLQNKKLRERTLFGTDFYVVRNHKSEKQMLAEMQSLLSEPDFDCIARGNPVNYLRNSLPPKPGKTGAAGVTE